MKRQTKSNQNSVENFSNRTDQEKYVISEVDDKVEKLKHANGDKSKLVRRLSCISRCS